ncbi:Ohr subfamily peroxiredoxin [Arthrobacter silviterrae]|uniref:Organic hydroperoxide resistance protein n=1 Tax=Arthrobacter silviterrae TaxID=2026658 RepID=A0ABX0D9A6_9MICC|nr:MULTISPECIES: organic hydroperoxide resistance protein [Arthrobacter]MCU6481737.1 organic hydroperoxide resistance protein [Arthrobacter sp. A2-55]MDQ0279152.1 Ohr subfamily peroxiredoxin [Arthrobacter silviterrae]NGN83273.1 organic hydroperoxide resistance protein [Arthrobacter silviterrae]
MKTLYTARALATGDGRDGQARTDDGKLAVDLASPAEMGGAGNGTNPEQLFAAGYAACFHSALRLVARRTKADVTGSSVRAEVDLGAIGNGAFGIAVRLEVSLPELGAAEAEELIEKAHQVCPYSNATRGNVDVQLSLATEEAAA